MAIWRNDGGDTWELAVPAAFPAEKTLHDLVEGAPHVLPLAGAPKVVVLGREVPCGSGVADLVGVEVNGRLVLVEVKLASNSEARRAVVAQILSYAAALRGLPVEQLDALLSGHFPQGCNTAADAVAAADQDGVFDHDSFVEELNECLRTGRFRLVLVLDSAPADLVRLVGYLESITDAGLLVDLITVAQYEINGSRVLVPQRIEPELQAGFPLPSPSKSGPKPVTTEGIDGFLASIEMSPPADRPGLERLATWATALANKRLVTLHSTKGTTGRTTLIPRVRGYDAGLVTVVNEHGPAIWMWRTVFERFAPDIIASVEQHIGKSLGQGITVTDVDQRLLDLLTDAHIKAVEQGPP